MNMQRTAYLVAHAYIDPAGRMLPQIHAVRIYSEDAAGLGAPGTVALDVYNMRGATYDDACRRLLLVVAEYPQFEWCRPLMKETQ